MGNALTAGGVPTRRGRYRATVLAAGLAIPLTILVPEAVAAVVPQCNGVDATIVGTSGRDNIAGTPGDDVIVGLGGNDRIRGEGGNDLICGGNGNDDINGGDGDDHIFGDAGRDDLQGGDGNDVVEGGDGNDSMKGGNGDDILLGQGGNKNDLAGGDGVDSCDVGDGGTTKQCENFPPSAVDDEYSTDEDTVLNVAAPGVLGNDSDPDGDPLTVVASDATSTAGTVVVNPDGSFTYDPNGQFEFLAVGESATDTFTYTAGDGILTDSATVTITIAGVNDPPTANDDSGAGFETDEDNAFTTGNVLSNDTDLDASDVLSVLSFDDSATFGTVTSNGDGTFAYDPNGQFEWLGAGDESTDTFEYTVSDGNGGTDTATVTVKIVGLNDPPVANDDSAANATGTYVTDEDTATIVGNVLDNDTDPDPFDSLSVIGLDTTGTVGFVVNNLNGTFSYDPNGQFEALNDGDTAFDSFEYTIADGNGGTDTATVTITIVGVTDNFPPDARDDDVTTDEDTPLNGDVLADNGNGADSDPDGDPITVTEVHGNAANVGVQLALASGALLTVNAVGTFSYDPNGQFESLGIGDSTTDSFEYTIADSPFGATDTATVTVTITGVDDAPVAVDDAATVAEDDPATLIDVLANDSDVDGGPKLVASVTQPANGTVVNNGMDVTYQPDPDYCNDGSPTDDFTYTLNGGSSATVRVTVNCDDDPPVAVNDFPTVSEDAGATAINVLVNDVDVDGGPIEVASVTQPANGTVTNNGTNVSYEPDANYCNSGGPTDDFTYTLSPGGSTATVSVTVSCVDDPPVAVDDSATVIEDDPATAINVLVNDTDVDGGPKAVASVTQPANGTVVITGGGTGLTYQPDPNYCNDGTPTDDFTYTLSPGGSTATVSVTVTCVPEPPDAVDDSYDALGNVPIGVLATAGLLVNDNSPDDPVFAVTAFDATSTAGGAVAVAADGGFTYQPPPGFEGADTFTYTITTSFASGSQTDTATVTVTVTDVIWFIDNSAGAPGNGTLPSPFNTLAGFNSGAADDPGDVIFVEETGSGDYTGGLTLLNNQILVGNGATASIASVAGVTVPAFSAPLPATGGTRPTISESGAGNGITLASGNTIRGLDVANTGGGAGISGSSVGTLTVDEVGATSIGGPALDIDIGVMNLTIDGVTVPSSSAGGIDLTGISGSSTINLSGIDITTSGGTGINVTGAGTLNVTGSGNEVTTTGGAAVIISGTQLGGSGVTFESLSSSSTSTNGISLTNTGAGTFTVTGVGTADGSGGTLSAITNDGVRLANTDGLVTLDNMNFTDIGNMAGPNNTRAGHDAIHGENVDGGLSIDNATADNISDNFINGAAHSDGLAATRFAGLTITNSNVSDTNRYHLGNNDTSDEGGVRIVGLSGTVTITGNVFERSAEMLDIFTSTTEAMTMTVTGNTFMHQDITGSAPTGKMCADVTIRGSASHTVTVGTVASGNTFLNCPSASLRIIPDAGSSGTVNASVVNNDFRVTDHSDNNVNDGSANWPQGGVALRTLGTGQFNVRVQSNDFGAPAVAGNATDYLSNADGAPATLLVRSESGALDAEVLDNNFYSAFNAVWIAEADGAGATADIRFADNFYEDAIINLASEFGVTFTGPGFSYDVLAENGGTMNFTITDEALAQHEVDPIEGLDFEDSLQFQARGGSTLCGSLTNVTTELTGTHGDIRFLNVANANTVNRHDGGGNDPFQDDGTVGSVGSCLAPVIPF